MSVLSYREREGLLLPLLRLAELPPPAELLRFEELTRAAPEALEALLVLFALRDTSFFVFALVLTFLPTFLSTLFALRETPLVLLPLRLTLEEFPLADTLLLLRDALLFALFALRFTLP